MKREEQEDSENIIVEKEEEIEVCRQNYEDDSAGLRAFLQMFL